MLHVAPLSGATSDYVARYGATRYSVRKFAAYFKGMTEMAELVTAEFKIAGLTARALNILEAAVIHAQKNRCVRLHTMSIESFCRLASIQTRSDKEFSSLLREASRAVGVIEVIDTVFPHRDDLPYSTWAVFTKVGVAGSNVFFEICECTFDERLQAKLYSLGHSGLNN